jgi:hypothetical protein
MLDLSLAKLIGDRPEHFLYVGSVVIGSYWKDLLSGSLIANIRLDSPRLIVDLERISHRSPGRDNATGSSRENEANKPVPWQKKARTGCPLSQYLPSF